MLMRRIIPVAAAAASSFAAALPAAKKEQEHQLDEIMQSLQLKIRGKSVAAVGGE